MSAPSLHPDVAGFRQPARDAQPVLPAWPLGVLVYGFPVYWVLGLAQFLPVSMAPVMCAYMTIRGGIRVLPGQWAWVFLTIWALASSVTTHGGTDILAWGLRFAVIFTAGVAAVYYANARETISPDFVIRGICLVWAFTVVMGNLALVFPDARITTPMASIMPSGLTRNELVEDFVYPRLTETQQPWGAPEAYVRPSAPFTYANSWGLALLMGTPVVLARIGRARSGLVRWVYIALLALAVVPAVASSNRGMFLAIALSVAYVLVRLAFRGRWAVVVWGIAVTAAGAVFLSFSGAAEAVLGRQEYSDSTGGRTALYQATYEATLGSPLLGHGTSRMEPSVGISMGTQGYFWAMLFCYGFVGLAFFLYFLWGNIVRLWTVRTTSGLWLHAALFAAAVACVVYSFDMTHTTILLCVTAVLLRSREDGEGL